MTQGKLISPRTFPCSLIAALALVALAGNAPAFAAGARPHWDIITRSAPTSLPPHGRGEIDAVIINLGDAPVVATPANPVEITDTLPDGVVATGTMEGYAASGAEEYEGLPGSQNGLHFLTSCEAGTTQRCPYVGTLPPYIAIEVEIPVEAPSAGALGDNVVEVKGGEAPLAAARVSRPITAGSGETPFGVESYELSPEEANGSPDLQAGSHPFQLTDTVEFNETFVPDSIEPSKNKERAGTPALLRNLNNTLPPGLIGNATAIPRCSDVEFSVVNLGNSNDCPADTAIGVVVVSFREPQNATNSGVKTETVPVFNLVPAQGEPARFGFEYEKVPVSLETSVQTGKGYAVEVKSENTSETAEILSAVVTIWGVPNEASHDEARGWQCIGDGQFDLDLEAPHPCEPLGEVNPPPYLTLPTTCGTPLSTSVEAQSWRPGATMLAPVKPAASENLLGCNQLPFNPSITVQPDQRTASTPTGLAAEIKVPQETTLTAGELAEADIKDTTVTFPEGMQASAGAADGLETCTVTEAGFSGLDTDTGGVLEEELGEQRFSPEVATCPEASKIGEVTIHSPLLEAELKGALYLASQDTNPFASPLVLYIIIDEPDSPIRVKLAGEVRISATGRLVSVFKNTPPLPFETLKLHLFGGERASQATPPLCGSYETDASFVPWSEEPGVPAVPANVSTKPEEFEITGGPDGSPCPASKLPFAPSFQAGVTDTQAGADTPFELTVEHPDGDQALESITIHLPPGLAGLIKEVTPCPEEAALSDACGPESLVGQITSVSGLGGDPVTLAGKLYLTGALQQTNGHGAAPFGLLAVTPAVAGPFHLGDVNVFSTINVNPDTAAVTVHSEPIPKMLKGVPVQLKTVHVIVQRPEDRPFQFNPTNCSTMSITGTLKGYEEASGVGVVWPFQAANCAALAFHPEFTASTSGQTSKEDGASLDVKITYPPGAYANIAKSVTDLPYALPSRLTTIQKACPDTVFEANPTDCDEGSLIGEGIVRTPVFKNELRGPAYLVSHGDRAFPDIEIVLQGEGVTLVLDGETDIKHGVTKTTFNSVPDAPVEVFELLLPEGPHSALAANENLCDPAKTVSVRLKVTSRVHGRTIHSFKTVTETIPESLVIPTTLTAQNGLTLTQNTPIVVAGCGEVKSFKAGAPTRAQKLAAALKACRRDRDKGKREACEAQARRQYGPVKKANGSIKAAGR